MFSNTPRASCLILPAKFLTYFKITKVPKVKNIITVFRDEYDTLLVDITV